MYKISLSENDLLTYLLYKASKSRITKVGRIRSWIILLVSFTAIAIIFHFTDNEYMRNYFIGVGLLVLIAYPFYQNWRYRHHFIKYIRLEHGDKLGVEGVITLGKDKIEVFEEGAELILSLSEIEQINEIQDYIFIKTQSGESVIIPKEQIDAKKFIAELRAITGPKGIVWNSELNWRWR